MLIADSHEFIELYRGDKDLRMGIEMLKVDADLRFVSFAPDMLSPNDRARFKARRMSDAPIQALPERFDLRLLPSLSIRFAQKESGGIASLMPGYGRALKSLHPDVIFENPFSWLTPRSYQTARYAVHSKTPVIYYDPGDDIPISLKHKVMAVWEAPVVRRAAAIITYNDAGRARFINKYRYPAERIHVIPKPVDVKACRFDGDVSSLRREFGAGESDLVVGYVGRLAAYKGSATLLAVARNALSDERMKRIRFVFIGGALASGETQESYELPNTYVTGMLPHEDVARHIAACDALVFPDVAHPGGFPTSVAEAMAAGRALVLGIGERQDFMPVRDGETALCVQPSNVAQITDALLNFLESRQRMKALGEAVGAFAASEMDYPVVARRYLELAEACVHA